MVSQHISICLIRPHFGENLGFFFRLRCFHDLFFLEYLGFERVSVSRKCSFSYCAAFIIDWSDLIGHKAGVCSESSPRCLRALPTLGLPHSFSLLSPFISSLNFSRRHFPSHFALISIQFSRDASIWLPENISKKGCILQTDLQDKRPEMPNNGHYNNRPNLKKMESSGKDVRATLAHPCEPLLDESAVVGA